MARKIVRETATQAIAKLLQTEDKDQQLERIRSLLAPVYDIVVRFDPRNGRVTVDVIGGGINSQQVKGILHTAIEQIVAAEAEQRIRDEQKTAGNTDLEERNPGEDGGDK